MGPAQFYDLDRRLIVNNLTHSTVDHSHRIGTNTDLTYFRHLQFLLTHPTFVLPLRVRARFNRLSPVQQLNLDRRINQTAHPVRLPITNQLNLTRILIWRSAYTVINSTGQSSCDMNQLCYCCGISSISVESYLAGHILAHGQGGTTTLDNLRPICQMCNLGMATLHMGAYITAFNLSGQGLHDPAVMSHSPADLLRAQNRVTREVRQASQ